MKEEFLKFKGKMCWLYLNHEDMDYISVYRSSRSYEDVDRTYKGRFIIKDIQWYEMKPYGDDKYNQAVFYIHPLTCSTVTMKIRFPDFRKLFQKFEDDEDTIIFKLLANMGLIR